MTSITANFIRLSLTRPSTFTKELLQALMHHKNEEALVLINDYDINESDYLGTLLHRCAAWKNSSFAEHLVNQGININAVGQENKTALMLAIESKSYEIIKILMRAGADFYIVDSSGSDAISKVLVGKDFGLIESFFQELSLRIGDRNQLVNYLIFHGCSLYECTFLRDTAVLRVFLQNGFHVNGGAQTALHAAAQMDDLIISKWLLDRGANVNTMDGRGNGPLFYAASHLNEQLIRLLLEEGADPNTIDNVNGRTSLNQVLEVIQDIDKKSAQTTCAELLLHYGALPSNSKSYIDSMEDSLLVDEYCKNMLLIVPRLAMLDNNIVNTVLYPGIEIDREKYTAIRQNLGLCRETLTMLIHKNLTLLEALTMKEKKFRLFIRDVKFMNDLKIATDKLAVKNDFYAQFLQIRIDRAKSGIILQAKAIHVICNIFNANYNQCYIFATIVTEFLTDNDLKMLIMAFKLEDKNF